MNAFSVMAAMSVKASTLFADCRLLFSASQLEGQERHRSLSLNAGWTGSNTMQCYRRSVKQIKQVDHIRKGNESGLSISHQTNTDRGFSEGGFSISHRNMIGMKTQQLWKVTGLLSAA